MVASILRIASPADSTVNRMSRELHDTVVHTLSGLSVQLETTKAYWQVDPDTARGLYTDVRANHGAHEANVFDCGAGSRHSGGGLHEIGSSLDRKFTGEFLFVVGEQAVFDDDLQVRLAVVARVGERVDFILNTVQNDRKEITHVVAGDVEQAWLDGDLARLGPALVGRMKAQIPALYAALLERRNELWADKIAKELATGDKVELVNVGALHMVGDDGLPALLAARGYAVQRVQ